MVRLQRTHALMVAGETTMAIALADSLFLSISPDAARTKVVLFLLVSLAPFAVVAPLVAPLIDRMRGGQRAVVIMVGILRAAVLVGMSQSLESLTLFPLAFSALILGKTYAISKSALVPVIVGDADGLVNANSKLGQVAGITGFVVAVPAGVLQLVDTRLSLFLGVVAYLAAAMNAYRLPKMVVASRPPGKLETEELHSPLVVTAANTMRLLRAVVGFVFFHLAFWLREQVAGTAWFGFAVALSGLGTLGANFVGPHLRVRMREMTMLFAALAAVCAAGFATAWYDRVLGGVLLAAVVNASAAIGRLAFESIVQSGAPDANRGRAFARFETQNQLAWVMGGIIPVLLRVSGWVGFLIVALAGAAGIVVLVRSGAVFSRGRGARATGRERRSRSGSEDSRGPRPSRGEPRGHDDPPLR